MRIVAGDPELSAIWLEARNTAKENLHKQKPDAAKNTASDFYLIFILQQSAYFIYPIMKCELFLTKSSKPDSSRGSGRLLL